MKAFKAFVKPFEAPQRSMKIKISVNFFSLSGIGAERVKMKIRYIFSYRKKLFEDGKSFILFLILYLKKAYRRDGSSVGTIELGILMGNLRTSFPNFFGALVVILLINLID